MAQKLTLMADVFSPEHDKIINFSGDHPSKVLKLIPSLLKSIFKMSSTNVYEDDFKWDRSGDPVDFFAIWRGQDKKDNKTAVWIMVKAQGKQNVKDKKGYVTIMIHPYIKTSFPYSNSFDKALIKTYSHFFYGNQRKKYIERELIRLKEFEDEIKTELGIR